jgi:hypothetical protein
MNEERIQALFREITNALANLETEIRLTYDTPNENINKDQFLLANIPDNYIRTAEYYRVNYRLNQMIIDRIQINNIAYSLQLSDFFNYMLYRINLFGVIKNLFIKNAIINIFSIQEGILYSSLMSLNSYCRFNGNICRNNSTCQYYVKSRNQLTFNSLLQTFQDRIGFYHVRYRDIMFKLKEIRDNVHLEDVQYSEWAETERYSIDQYHDALLSLRYLKFQLHTSLTAFIARRNNGCTIRTAKN